MSRVDPLLTKEAMVRDAANEQRSNGVTPGADTEAFVKGILERFDRKRAEEQATKTTPSGKKPDALKKEFERRGGADGAFGDWRVTRGPKEPVQRIQRKTLNINRMQRKIIERLRLLRTKYDWVIKLEAINPLATNGSLGEERRRQAEAAYWRILRESIPVFGPIFADKPKPLWFS